MNRDTSSSLLLLGLLPYILSLAVTLGLTIITFRRRSVKGARSFSVVIFIEMLQTIGYILELVNTSLEAKMFWDNFQWFTTLLFPVTILMFVHEYSYELSRGVFRGLALVGLIGISMSTLISLNQFPGFGILSPRVISAQPFSIYTYDLGPLLYIAGFYSYILILLGFTILVREIIRHKGIYRMQTAIILVGLLIPVAGTVLVIAGIDVMPNRDISPITVSAGNFLIALGLFRYGIFNIIPVARSAVMDHSVDPMVILDSQDLILDINPAFEKLLRQTKRELLRKHILQYVPSLESQNIMLQQTASRQEGLKCFGEIDGYFDITSNPLTSRLGMFAGRLLVFHDITRRKNNEEALRESESKIRAITDSARDAILMLDPSGCISFWNPAAESMFGYTIAEAMGQNLNDLILPRNFPAAHPTVFPVFTQNGQNIAVGKLVEMDACRRDGSVFPIQLSLSALQLNGGWFAVGIISDITERKRNENELIQTNRQLEASISRANAFAEQADMANIAKSSFLANMSHEIRTPMNGVIGMVGLLLDTDLSEEQQRFAEIVKSSAESLLALINDILDFSKIEAGKLELEILDFDLRNLLDDFSATVAVRAQEKKLEFLCAAAPDVPNLLRGDPGRLRQILTNLVGNAIKFTAEGEVSVRITCLSTPNEKKTTNNQPDQSIPDVSLRFSIHDSGIGIPADKINTLFTKFTQVDASTTRHFGGSGLGLAISKQLAEMMGGEIGVTSELGRGSDFWFTVRLGLQPISSFCEPAPDLNGVRILIIDDNATSREILNLQLSSWNMRSEQVSDGITALQTLINACEHGDPFRAAVLDMQMPIMDGAMLGELIKNDQRISGTSLVLLSSLGERGDAKRFAKIGFSGYLSKPIRHTDLYNVLATALTCDQSITETRPIVTRHSAREIQKAPRVNGARILLAEDNLTNQLVAQGLLSKLGMKADIVSNGAEAIAALERLPYDLVLMDVQMPVLDGISATQRVRDHTSSVLNHNIPIIAMTANAMHGDRQICLDAGMNDHVTKPISLEALSESLERWLPVQQGSNKPGENPSGAPSTAATQIETSGQQQPQIFDKTALMQRLTGDVELARLVLATFLDDMPVQIKELRDYLDANDVPGATRKAHTIKGSAANIGAGALQAVAAKMEEKSKTGDLLSVRDRLDELDAQLGRLKELLQHEI